MKKPLIINLYGAPSAGKSTGAAYIFYQLKLKGVDVELVTEFAKDKLYEQSKQAFDNQAYIFGKQFFRMSRLEKAVDVIVTDSPLMLQAYYAEKYEFPYADELIALVRKVVSLENARNFFLERVKPYNPKGRFQTENESDEIANELKAFLNTHEVNCAHVEGSTKGYDHIVTQILNGI